MTVAEVVGRVLAAYGVGHVFGVVGSGNFHVTNALVAGGMRRPHGEASRAGLAKGATFVASAHEAGAATMADAYARTSGRVGVLSVHQGPGVTNALTGIAEAAKSHTPVLVLAPEATAARSNFFIDLRAAVTAVGARFQRVRADSAAEDVAAAYGAALRGNCVVLGLPLDVQAAETRSAVPDLPEPLPEPVPAVDELVAAVRAAERPVFIGGRGARGAREQLVRLADRCGALLAVSAAAKGLFAGDPWNLDISGGFATPIAGELIGAADLVVAWGSTLNMWTTRHQRLIGPDATVVQVDRDVAALGINRPVDVGVCGDVAAVAAAVDGALDPWRGTGYRSDALRDRIAAEGRWRDVSYVDDSTAERIDARTVTVALDDLLPADRTVAVDSGNFMGYPAAYLSVPDAEGFCFTQGFQSIGLGLATALGAAVARPDRLTVAALGDGGFLMSAAELVTASRLGLPLLIVVYNDAAYGAEVHHFGEGHPLDTVRFPDTDLAAIARGYGCEAVTVRSPADLDAVRDWLAGDRGRPMLVDAKVTTERGSWWLEEAFRGH